MQKNLATLEFSALPHPLLSSEIIPASSWTCIFHDVFPCITQTSKVFKNADSLALLYCFCNLLIFTFNIT